MKKIDLQDAVIVDFLWARYGLQAVEIDFLPRGGDIHAAVYRIIAKDGGRYFLKLIRGDFDQSSGWVPRFLRDLGIEQIIAPIATLDRQLWTQLEGFTAILYPFLEGRNAFEAALTELQWVNFGAALRRTHAAEAPPELSSLVHHEVYSPQWRERVRMLLGRLNNLPVGDSIAAQYAGLVSDKADEIRRLIQKAELLCSALKAQEPKVVLCHSDIHAGNLLIDANGSLFIIDWDHPILAPKERDLMFIGGGIGSSWYKPQEEAWFYEGYGRTEVNPVALAYYRFERIVEDIAEWGEKVLLTNEGGADRARALPGFIRWFSPHDVVEMAYQAEKALPPELKSR